MASDMSGYSGAEGAKKWMQESGGDQAAYNREMNSWKNSQPGAAPSQFKGGGPTEITATNRQTADMTPQQRAAWAAQNINSFDAQSRQGRNSGGYSPDKAQAQWEAWDKHYDASCPPNLPYRGRAGQCAESPDNCPEGTSPRGTAGGNTCQPNEAGGGGGGGGQGGVGGGAGGGQGFASGGGWDNPIYKYLSGSAMNAAQDPEAGLKQYMGFGGATQWSQQVDNARNQVNMMAPGPARDAAMARLEEQKLTSLGGMKQAAAQQARGELLNPIMGQEFGYTQLGENARQANQQNALGWGGLDLQRYLGNQQNELGWGNLGLGYGQLNENARQFGSDQAYNEWAQRGNWANQGDLQNQQLQAQKPSTFDRAMQGAGTAAGLYGMYKDLRK